MNEPLQTSALGQPSSMKKTKPRWVQILLLLVIFASGGVIGSILTARAIVSRIHTFRSNPSALPDQIVPRLSLQLGLTDSQTEKVDSLFRTTHRNILNIHKNKADEIHKEFESMRLEISKLLNEKQKPRWDMWSTRIKERVLPPL